MNDTELSPAEDARLRQLLQRAAEGVEVVTPTAAPGPAVTSPQRRRGPQVLALAAVIALVAGGAWFATARGDGDRVDTGPATADEDLPAALRETGIWRLPTELPPGSRIGGAYVTTSTAPQLQLAVDDPDAPNRWLAVWPVGIGIGETGGLVPARTEGGGSQATITMFRPDERSPSGSTWVELTGVRQAWSAVIAFRGVEEDDAMAIARQLAADIGDTSDVEAMGNGLRGVRVPDGLEPTWDPEDVGYDPDRTEPTGLTLVVVDEAADDRSAEMLEAMSGSISLQHTGLPPALASLAVRLEFEASSYSAPNGGFLERPLDDVGPGAFMLEAQGVEYPTVFAADGTRMSLDVAPGGAASWSKGDSLRTLLSLRTMSEQDLRATLAAQGVELQDDPARAGREAAASGGSSAPTDTTMVPDPGTDQQQAATTVPGGGGPTTTVLGPPGG